MPVDVARASVFEAAMPSPASACSFSSIGKDSDECAPPGKEEGGRGWPCGTGGIGGGASHQVSRVLTSSFDWFIFR
jgi:hypothetical protein